MTVERRHPRRYPRRARAHRRQGRAHADRAFPESFRALAGVPVHLKLEHRQTTGSFKLRGASNAIASLNAEEKARGVVAASTGNHGRALAHAAKLEGMRATICMSRLVPENKVDEIRRLGAEIRIVGNSQDDAQQEVDRLVAEDGLVMLPPFDHPRYHCRARHARAGNHRAGCRTPPRCWCRCPAAGWRRASPLP